MIDIDDISCCLYAYTTYSNSIQYYNTSYRCTTILVATLSLSFSLSWWDFEGRLRYDGWCDSSLIIVSLCIGVQRGCLAESSVAVPNNHLICCIRVSNWSVGSLQRGVFGRHDEVFCC